MDPGFFDSVDAAWWWVTIGLALAVLELVVPGVYLIWLALAALTTGAIAFVLDFGVGFQIVNFVALALIFALSARRYLRDTPIVSSDPSLNKRGEQLVGQSAVVTVPIEGGEGRVRVGDSAWIAHGPDAETGARMRIVRVTGSAVEVEPLNLLKDESTAPPALPSD